MQYKIKFCNHGGYKALAVVTTFFKTKESCGNCLVVCMIDFSFVSKGYQLPITKKKYFAVGKYQFASKIIVYVHKKQFFRKKFRSLCRSWRSSIINLLPHSVYPLDPWISESHSFNIISRKLLQAISETNFNAHPFIASKRLKAGLENPMRRY